jgi:L-2,4-diaminobutyrate decarboxylase
MALHHRVDLGGRRIIKKGLGSFSDPSRLTVVTSADAHFSLKHAVRVMGLGEQALLSVAVDRNRRMDVKALRATLERVSEERDVFCVVATAGTTSTGSVDPVAEIADVCAEHGVWLHVDGAYGLAYALVPEWRDLFQGIERADTVSWDPHKQMSVPIPSSILFARRRDDFARMALFSHYWNRPDTEGPNPGIKSMPSTRPFTALPLVTSIRHQGLAGVVDRLRRPLEAIRTLHHELRAQPDIEVGHEPDTGILCFRVTPAAVPDEEHDRLQEHIYETILAEGKRLISITKLDGRAALRLVAISPNVTSEAMLDTVAEARRIAESFAR